MAAPKVFKSPNTVTYNVTPVTGCTSITVGDSAAAQTAISDDGTLVHYVTKGSVSGTITFQDHVQALLISSKTTASIDLTFVVQDEAETAYTVTIANIKTGGVSDNYALNSPGSASVSFVADTVSSPTAA